MKSVQELVIKKYSKYANVLSEINISGEKLSGEFDLNIFTNLEKLDCSNNHLTSLNFLNTIPNPEKLEKLLMFNNDLEPADIKIFSQFINLTELQIGTTCGALSRGRNKFFGSLEAFKNMKKLRILCIMSTDIDQGLEYLPSNIMKNQSIEAKEIYCSPNNTGARIKIIQDQLRKYDYDLEAWQLAHPHLMYKARPELFFSVETKTKWVVALRDKTTQTKNRLAETKRINSSPVKKIQRLESKIRELELVRDNISSHSLIEKLEQNKPKIETLEKATQTEYIVGQK